MKCIIFDMDGTLIDSMPYWNSLTKEYLVSQGKIPPDDIDEITYSMNIEQCVQYFIDSFGIKKEFDEIINEVVDMMYQHYKNDIQLKPGMKDLIIEQYKNGMRMCIYTASDRRCVKAILKRFDLEKYIEKIFTVYDIGINKDVPDGFKKVCTVMNVLPQETIVYEDVLHAVECAKEAGCKVVAVYDEASEGKWNQIKEKADEFIFK